MEQELYILYSEDISVPGVVYTFESDVRQTAEIIARNNRGARICIAKIVACVSEPLPDLTWSDGAPAGSGRGGSPMIYGENTVGASSQKAKVAEERNYRSQR